MRDETTQPIRPEVRALDAYRLPMPPHTVKLNQNESPFELPETLKSDILDRLQRVPWSRYPQSADDDLAAALRDALDLPAAIGILTGNGSNELIQALFVSTLGASASLVVPVPTFPLYRQIASILGCSVVESPLEPDMSYDAERLLESVQKARATVVVLVRPNNPTGTVISAEDLRRFLVRTDALVVVDEAYHEFADDTVLPLLPDHENLVILRTFSKALRCAGLRIGYLAAHKAVTDQVGKVLLPYNLGIVGREAGLLILKHRADLRAGILTIRKQREAMTDALRRIRGISPFASQANFVCFRTERPPRLLFRELLAQGILVRDVSGYPMLSECLRVTVGTEEENLAFIAELKRIMEGR